MQGTGNNWGPHTARSNEEGGYDRVLACRRCTTKRHQVLDSNGIVLHNQYEYPEGYQMEPGTGRISGDAKGVFRIASIEQTIESLANRAEARRGRRSA